LSNGWTAGVIRGVRGLGYPTMTPEARLYSSPGRGSALNVDPLYRQDRIAASVDAALQELAVIERNLLTCRYCLKLSDALAARQLGLKSPAAARWATEKAHRSIAVQLRLPCYR